MRLKWILTGLLAVVAAVVVAGYAILSTMEFEELRGVVEAEAEAATGRKLVLAGPIDLEVSLSPAIAVDEVRFANAPWGSRDDMLTLRRLEVEVALLPLLTGDIRVRRLVLVEPDVLLETDAEGNGNWQTAAEAPAAAEQQPQALAGLPSFDEVVLRDAVVTYRDGVTGTRRELRLARLEGRAAGAAAPLEIALEGSFNEAAISASGTLGSFDQLRGAGGYPVALEARAGGATLSLSGTIAEPLAGRGIDLEVETKGERLAELGALAGAALPPFGPYDLSARIAQPDARSFKLTALTAKLGESDLAGSATLRLDGPRPALDANLAADRLRLEDLAPPGGAAGAAPDEGRFVFTEASLPLDALTALDATVKLRAKEVALGGGLALSDLDVALALDNGKATLEPVSLGIAGGTVTGALGLDAGQATPPLKLDLTGKDIDYGQMLAARGITDGVSGKLDARLNLRGAGASARAIAASLSGRVEVVGGAGRVRHDLLGAAGAGLAEILSIWRERDEDLRLNCLVARLPLEGGVASAEAVLVDTQAATAGVTGEIDLRDESLDLHVTPQAKQTSLMSLAVPVLVGGTLKAPAVSPDPVGTAMGAAKIAGLFINPLAAGALIVLESEGAEQNPCVAALEGGGPAAGGQAPAQSGGGVEDAAKGAAQGAAEGAKEAVEGIGEGLSKGLKGLFGN